MSLLRKEITQKEMKKHAIKRGYERVDSLNGEMKKPKHIKLLIIGTITSPLGNGFFYTSPYNNLYNYIDKALGTSLLDLKHELNSTKKTKKRNEIIGEIKNILFDNGIYFLDVAKTVVRPINDSRDNKISAIVLDYKSFENLNKVDNIICISQDAEECFNKIVNKYKYIYLAQRGAKEELWVNTLKRYLK